MEIVVIESIPYYIGKEGSQCKCGSIELDHKDGLFQCKKCQIAGTEENFVCHTLPEGLILQRI